MTDPIEEKLLNGCGEIESIGRSPCSKENGLCDDCELKLQQHRESTQKERERIMKLIRTFFNYVFVPIKDMNILFAKIEGEA